MPQNSKSVSGGDRSDKSTQDRRLADSLRQNLKRRKAQTRGRAATTIENAAQDDCGEEPSSE